MTSSGESAAGRPLAILSAPGSRGDVNPMVAIGEALQTRGIDVVITLAEPYVPVAEAAGLTAVGLISSERFDQLLGVASVWRPLSGLRAVLQGAASEFLRPHFDLITRLLRPRRTVLVSHPLDFASRIHRDLDPSTPLVDVFLAPAMVRSPQAPPRVSPWWIEPRKSATLIRVMYALADHLVLDRYLAPDINRLRREHDLAPVRRIMDRWWLSPDLVLGMYPDWFADIAPPTGGRWQTCGFPLQRGDRHRSVGGTGQSWELLIEAGKRDEAARPLLFTPGTAHRHAQLFFARAIEACRALRRPGILATSHSAQLPTDLPPAIAPAGYVQFDAVLPHCGAIVHHGGIGTTAAALAAGCPQLVLPMAFDQFDNAERVTALNVGQQVLRPSAGRLTEALRKLLADPQLQARCAHAASKLAGVDGASVAADQIASLLRSQGSS